VPENLERSDREEAPDAAHGGRGNFSARRVGRCGAVFSARRDKQGTVCADNDIEETSMAPHGAGQSTEAPKPSVMNTESIHDDGLQRGKPAPKPPTG